MNRQKGFTIIETVLVILLVSAGLYVIIQMFLSETKIYRTENAQLDISSQTRLALDDIDNYVRQSYRTLDTYSTYTAGPQTLILEVPSVNSSDQLIAGKYDFVVYTLSGSVLARQIFPDALSYRVAQSKTLASNVTSLTFTYNDPDYAQVTEVATALTQSENAFYQTKTISYDSKAKLRDH